MTPPAGFRAGDEVEVSSDEEGYRGAFFEARIVRFMPKLRRYTVDYETIVDDRDQSRPHRETVDAGHVRPRPPRKGLAFEAHDPVDAYFNDAWWVGVAVRACEGAGERWVVCFPATREVMEFEGEMVRVHLEWIGGRWVKPEVKENSGAPFDVGVKVEVVQLQASSTVSWFSAIVMKKIWKDNYLVEYLKTVDGTELTTEIVNLQHVRHKYQDNLSQFHICDYVEALYLDGWCPGVITNIVSQSNYLVKLDNIDKEVEFTHLNLRHKYELVNGHWVQKAQSNGRVNFKEGDLVEVRSDEEGFSGAWFVATIVKMIRKNKYIVEYQDLKTDDETALLRETVDFKYIRPPPPIVPVAGKLRNLEEVDAWNNDGWWVGLISKVHGDKYTVYFKAWQEEAEFTNKNLRPHQEWIDGKWWRPSLDLL